MSDPIHAEIFAMTRPVSSRGQVVIPRDIRANMGNPGEVVFVFYTNGDVLLKAAPAKAADKRRRGKRDGE